MTLKWASRAREAIPPKSEMQMSGFRMKIPARP
jgi:hypothetical protein